MSLLNLPLELFQKVVHELVLTEGIKEAWEHRAVCGTFATEIYEEVFTRSDFAFESQSTPNKRTGLNIVSSTRENREYFLERRVNARLTIRGYRYEEIIAIAEDLANEDPAPIKRSKKEFVNKLCQTIAIYNSTHLNIEDLFTEAYEHPYGEDVRGLDRVSAAAAINEPGLLSRLLAKLPSTQYLDAPVFGYPTEVACKLGHTEVLKVLLEHQRTAPEYSEGAIGTKLPLDEYEALELCIPDLVHYKHYESIKVVLASAEAYHPWVYREYLLVATKSKDAKAAHIILDATPKSYYLMTVELFEHVCHTKDASLVTRLIAQGILEPNKPLGDRRDEKSHPLECAIRIGHPCIVSALLAGGADVNHARDGDIQNSPLYIAIVQRNPAVVKALLQAEQKVHMWASMDPDKNYLQVALQSRHREIYELVRRASIRDAARIPHYDRTRKRQRTN